MGRQDPYLYEDVPVLKNLLRIKNKVELRLVERGRSRTTLRTVYAKEYEKFDAAGLSNRIQEKDE